MNLIFCADSADVSRVEDSLAREWNAAQVAGGTCNLVSHDDAVSEPFRAVRRRPDHAPGSFHRGKTIPPGMEEARRAGRMRAPNEDAGGGLR